VIDLRRQNNRVLFHENSLQDYFENRMLQIKNKAESIDKNTVLDTDIEVLVDSLFEIYKIKPLNLLSNKYNLKPEPKEVQFESRDEFGEVRRKYHSVFEFQILCNGDAYLWKCKPDQHFKCNIEAKFLLRKENMENDIIEVKILIPNEENYNETDILNKLSTKLDDIEKIIKNINEKVNRHNNMILSKIQETISRRKQSFEKNNEIVKAINIKLSKNMDAPNINIIPIKKDIIKPIAQNIEISPAWTISEDDYEYILKVIRHVGRTFEKLPKTFSKLGETGLRDVIIANLNGYYEGLATSETFRMGGKTDICIEYKNRSAFVAECKIWHGKSELSKAIDQLLRYLTWRDCKTSIILFNTEKSAFLKTQSEIPLFLNKHPNSIKQICINEKGEWRYELCSLDDEEQKITIHFFLFNLYIKKE
jgi:hypothetical protein